MENKDIVGTISHLYEACLDGDVTLVHGLLLSGISLEKINRVEPNGSTCLHAACYSNHPEVVQLLLDSGASRTIKNKNGCTPLDEAASSQIKRLFPRSAAATEDRFFSNSSQQASEWVSVKNAGMSGKARIKVHIETNTGAFGAAHDILGDPRFKSFYGRPHIEYYLEEAMRTKDATQLIKAYSAETAFYRIMNEALAQGDSYIELCLVNHKIHSFIQCIFTPRLLNNINYRYFGKSYRGMKLSREDFEKNYRVGQIFLINPFISTSKLRNIAEFWAEAHSSNTSSSFAVLCTYVIPENVQSRDMNVALDISSISEFPDEEEVLILPHVCFNIQSIKHLPSEFIEIQLEFER